MWKITIEIMGKTSHLWPLSMVMLVCQKCLKYDWRLFVVEFSNYLGDKLVGHIFSATISWEYVCISQYWDSLPSPIFSVTDCLCIVPLEVRLFYSFHQPINWSRAFSSFFLSGLTDSLAVLFQIHYASLHLSALSKISTQLPQKIKAPHHFFHFPRSHFSDQRCIIQCSQVRTSCTCCQN